MWRAGRAHCTPSITTTLDWRRTMTLETARAILEVRQENSAPVPVGYTYEELAAFERRLVRLRHLQYVLRTLRG
jgi:hypothetical protein